MSTGKGWSAADQPKSYSTNASFVYSSQYTSPTLALLDPKPGEWILDVGCGSGELTHGPIFDAVSSGSGYRVVGTDVSESMVSRARELAGDKPVSYLAVDGHDLSRHSSLAPFKSQFGAVFSNAALHWMKEDPSAVVGEVKTMLGPGGRFVAEMGGHLNISPSLPLWRASNLLTTTLQSASEEHCMRL